MKEITILSTEIKPAGGMPFSSVENNDSFAHLCQIGEANGIYIVVTGFESYESGVVSDAWVYETHGWNRTGRRPVEFIWDRCNISNKQRQKLNENKDIPVFNHFSLMALCRDKKANSDLSPESVIPTETVNGSIDEIVDKIEKIRKMSLHPDLDPCKIVLKPRFEYSGRGILGIKDENYEKLKGIENRDYVIQPFLETSTGIRELGIEGRHDLRIIVLNGRPLLSYARLARQGHFISGVRYGAKVKYVKIADIGSQFMDVVCSIDGKLNIFNPRMYSVDLGKGKERTWIFELNGFPSVVWEPDDTRDIQNTKKMHERIIKTLAEYLQ
ncbi:hypothetical protein KY338_01785 [Candidatus Woesearchaeota archaeon]|nr:hypothetical protein [Candidatus Woesearchaeota archaeon]MBW3005991.1 hypothetical protein [Candidatus Woesearchaeota archaeon]